MNPLVQSLIESYGIPQMLRWLASYCDTQARLAYPADGSYQATCTMRAKAIRECIEKVGSGE